MRRPAVRVPTLFIAALLLCTITLSAGVVGVFQGKVVLRKDVKPEAGILYVESRQGMARKVRVGDAVIEYDEDVPKSQRKAKPAESLCENTLVRVTAEQSDEEDGPWKALNILILVERPKETLAPGERFSRARAQGFTFQEARLEKGPDGSPPASGDNDPASAEKSPKAGQSGKGPDGEKSGSTGTNGSCWAK